MKISELIRAMSPDERLRAMLAMIHNYGQGPTIEMMADALQERADATNDQEMLKTASVLRERRNELRLMGD